MVNFLDFITAFTLNMKNSNLLYNQWTTECVCM